MRAQKTIMPTGPTPWHAMDAEAVLARLRSASTGLTAGEARERLSRHGPNRLSPPRKRGPLVRFGSQFRNVLIYVLLGAAALTAVLGHMVDAGVIAAVVLVNAFIGFIQEGKAERALEAIRGMLSYEASVMRDARRTTVPAEDVVPGDVVFIQSGDRVPADLRLMWVKDLRVDEAALTGESVPVEKSREPVDPEATVGDRKSMAFSGTLVTYGQATGVAVATGDDTEIGLINMLLSRVQPLTTRLLRQMAEFGQTLTVAIGAVASAAFVFGIVVREYSVSEMFMAAVGLAVAAIPEGLPAIITITLAIGVQRMARRNAIIRRLPAVETLGSVTIVCSDKTGTLTRNEMTVQTASLAEEALEVSGVGYDPHGGFTREGSEVNPLEHPQLQELARGALLCNDAVLEESGGRWRLSGEPTEGALVTLAMKAGLEPRMQKELYYRVDVIPFESEHRFMATLHHNHAGHAFIYVKGAPEKVLEMCNRERARGEDRPLDIARWERRIEEMASRGQRIIAVAFREAEDAKGSLVFSDVEGGLSLLGLCGIIDPPRTEAIEAVKQCKQAGIRVKMITGDHALTARAVGARMGIGDGRTVRTGRELDGLSDEDLRAAAEKVDIFARVSPEHKLRLVEALQARKQVVAMTGDGVNDAPALKRADVGVAMGIKGTEVAKEAAEMVLADDNFASIAHAVEEGRTVYDNIKKAITFILPTNGGEAGIIVAAIMAGRVLPITPVQILWVNMITAVTLALSLAFEPAERAVMKRPPRDPGEPILSLFLLWRIAFVSIIIVVGTFGLFLWDRLHEVSIESSRTVAVNALVMFEVFYLLSTRSLREPVLSREGLLGNRAVHVSIALVLGAQILFTYLPPVQRLFGSAPVGFWDWVRIVLVAASVFALVEGEKQVGIWQRRRRAEVPEKILRP
jgi:magnesium-transporting ATPase (P-type)